MKALSLAVTISLFGIISLKGVYLSDCNYHYGKHCFTYEKEYVTLNNAKEKCRLKGGELPAVYNMEMLQILGSMIHEYYDGRLPWIAPVRRTDEGEVFPDGTLLNRSLVYDETSLERIEMNRICLYLDPRNDKLHDYDCNDRRYFSCQFKGKACYVDSEDLISLSNDETCMQAFTANHLLQPMQQIPVVCKNGYVIENSSNITCLANGILTGMRQCIAGCHPPEISKTARIIDLKNIYKVNDEILIVCEKGFFGVGDNVKTHLSATCLPGGQWSVKDFNCTNIRPFRPNHNTLDEEPKMITEGSNVVLQCSENGTQNVWIKDDNIISEVDELFVIKNFSSNDVGLYTCISTNNKFSIHNLQIKRVCPNFDNNFFKATAMEDSKLFLTCNRSRNASEIKWFKNNERFWGNEKVKILRNGMIIFENVHWFDAGDYVCMVSDMVNECSLNTTIRVQVKPKDKCGLIAGDVPLEGLSQLPWLVVLWWPSDFMPFCYGTLISDRWIVTTASCLFGSHRRKKPGFIVKLGKDTEDLENVENTAAKSVIAHLGAVVIHPNYSKRLNNNDIGLIKLESPITLTDDYYPICLPVDPALIDQNSCQHWSIRNGSLSGYGPLDSNWEYNNIVEKMQIAPQSDCQVTSPLSSSMFCANSSVYLEEFKGDYLEENVFAGDSGAPMQIKWKNRWFLWGIFSVGDRSSNSGKYDYFSKITYFLPWIKSIIINHS